MQDREHQQRVRASGAMTAWQDVLEELERWHDCGLRARFWLRDDDAWEVTPQLARLDDWAKRYGATIGLAVVPAKMAPSLLGFLAERTTFYAMCHGWKHIDYGPPGAPQEFGNARPFSALHRDAKDAYRAFSASFPEPTPIFVPPFGHITPELMKALSSIGFAGVSVGPSAIERRILRMSSRFSWLPGMRIPRNSNIPRFDVHVDPIDWEKGTARPREPIAADLVENLRFRRKGFLEASHPVGILTHHLVHDDEVWRICDELLELLKRHRATEILNVAEFIDAGTRHFISRDLAPRSCPVDCR
jgi:peptidoglycan/xylan/chitin deacetylase (PgdA/CDA1 family)